MKNLKYISFLLVVLLTLSTTAQTNDLNDVAINESNIRLVDDSKDDLNKKNEKKVKDSVSQDEEETKKSNWGVNYEVTLTSRFIWRGLVLGDYPSIQPNVTFSNGGFFAGIWASYSLSPAERGGASSSEVPVAENYKEIIPYIGYGGKVGENSNLAVMVLTHYNPNVGGFFDFDNVPDGGGTALTNRVELRTVYNIGKLDFFAGWDFMNDPTDNSSLYLEMGYTFDCAKGIKVRPFISGVPNDNYYTTDGKADLTQVGWYTSKSIPIGKDINLALKADMVYNPDRDQFNAAFNATIKL